MLRLHAMLLIQAGLVSHISRQPCPVQPRIHVLNGCTIARALFWRFSRMVWIGRSARTLLGEAPRTPYAERRRRRRQAALARGREPEARCAAEAGDQPAGVGP